MQFFKKTQLLHHKEELCLFCVVRIDIEKLWNAVCKKAHADHKASTDDS